MPWLCTASLATPAWNTRRSYGQKYGLPDDWKPTEPEPIEWHPTGEWPHDWWKPKPPTAKPEDSQ
jgi:hypothetical protein